MPLKDLRSERRILRLGEGVDQNKRLSQAAMDRVIQCLREWKAVIDTYRVDGCMAVATSAVRDAANRAEFLEKVKREAGFDVEVITGDEEARRTLLGIRSGLPPGVTDMLALDIGGGSTEFILDRPGQQPVVRSIDIGVVRLCERLLHHDPPTSRGDSAGAGMDCAGNEIGCYGDDTAMKRRPSSGPPERSPLLPPWLRNYPSTNRPASITID